MAKISKWGIDVILATDLIDTPIFENLLSRADLQVDDGGNVLEYQVDNLKTILKVAMRLSAASGDVMTIKFKKALTALLDYGTEESSDNIRKFLESTESKTPLIITSLPVESGYSRIGKIILPLMESGDVRADRGAVEEINMLLQSCEQDFSV